MSSGTNYDLGYSYQSNGSAVNLTGSPDYNIARVVFNGDAGSGCSSNQYAQFNTSVVSGPTYGSVGLESGRNMMRGCMQRDIDLSLARNIRLGGGRAVQLRMDTFNAFNIVNYTGRQAQLQLTNPWRRRSAIRQYLADGSIDPRPSEAAECGLRRGDLGRRHADGPSDGALLVLREAGRLRRLEGQKASGRHQLHERRRRDTPTDGRGAVRPLWTSAWQTASIHRLQPDPRSQAGQSVYWSRYRSISASGQSYV